jgi:long-chain acyl-CoA synthetase
VPDAKWGEAAKPVLVLRPGESASEDEILQFARSSIAGYKCPKSIDLVQQLPRNASGKLLKRVLREPYWSGHHRNVG